MQRSGGVGWDAPQGAACHEAVMLKDMSIMTEQEPGSERGRETLEMGKVKLRKMQMRENGRAITLV